MQDERAEHRRIMREKRQQQVRRQKRNLAIGLSVAVVILVLCAGVIFGQDQTPTVRTQTTTPTDSAAAGTTAPAETQPKPEKTVINIAAAGDLNITDRVIAAGGSAMDFTNLFLDISPIFSDADYALVNFEGNIYGEPYGSRNGSAPQSMFTALRRAGVDMVQLANSYSIKNGLLGLSSTLEAAQNAGLTPVGTFTGTKDFRKSGGFTLVDIQGVKVAFVAFTKGMDGMGLPSGSEDCVNLLYTDYATTYRDIDYEGIRQILGNVKDESPDMTIALVHWGSEYNDQISSSQESVESLLRENGVNVIIGTHSHYVQKLTQDPESQALTAFSLGDLVGDGSRTGTDYSVILNLEITKNNRTGKVELTNYSYTPVVMFEGSTGLRLLRMESALRAWEYQYIDRGTPEDHAELVYNAQRVQERIAGED